MTMHCEPGESFTPCPPPGLENSLLPARHRSVLGQILRTLLDNGFRRDKLAPLLPGLVDLFATTCSTPDDVLAWHDELQRWVRWWRVPAYWLTFLYQLVTQKEKSPFHFLACDLYSDAQTHFADDLALVSLETAYDGYIRNRTKLGEAFAGVEVYFKRKLRVYYDYYHQWSRPFEYAECNPCADHLYSTVSYSWFGTVLANQEQFCPSFDAETLTAVIERCQGKDLVYYGVLARRFLGLEYDGQGRHELAAEQYRIALEQARELRLDTEIGHLRRLYGCALRFIGKVGEACHQFEQAYAFEKLEPFFCYTSYWQALSARELGDTLLRSSGHACRLSSGTPGNAAVAADDPAKLRAALNAYHDGRLFLNSHMSVQCPFPIARAAKQQIFRSFSANAIQAACLLQDTHAMLAEVEWHGPREATEVVTEIAAIRDCAPSSLAEFRRNRARYNKTLNTLPPSFDEYLASISQINDAKRAYLNTSFQLDGKLILVQSCDKIVERVLSLRLPNTVFLLFHVGPRASTIVLADMSAGVACPFVANFGERELQAVHRDYVRQAQDADGTERALDTLLLRYAELLGPVLEPVLRFLPGKHLKIFPRLQMNAVPLHALALGGKYLIEHCEAISYGQTLGLWLENHSVQDERFPVTLRAVVGTNVEWYEYILPKLRDRFGSAYVEDRQVTWPQLLGSINKKTSKDILFACHGEYSPDRLDDSALHLTADGSEGDVLFQRVFEELDLRNCRSVFMGACESGLTRSTISAEYIGLPSAMLSSGVRYVIGALWKIPEVATAVLVSRYLELIADDQTNVCSALCRAQRELMRMTRDQFAAWVSDLSLDAATTKKIIEEIKSMPERPFYHPHQWAGLQVVGDV